MMEIQHPGKASDATMGHLNGLKLELARAVSRRDSQGPRVGPPGPGYWDTRSFVGSTFRLGCWPHQASGSFRTDPLPNIQYSKSPGTNRYTLKHYLVRHMDI